MGSLELLAFSPPGWGGVLLRGLATSLTIAFGGYSVGLLIGIGGAFGKLYGGPVLRDLLACYTTIVRAIPELVLIVLLYYAGSDIVNQVLALFGSPPIDINGLVAGIVVIGFVQGAYSTEVLRGAIKAIAPGQIEAARSYAMGPGLLLRRIILPIMLPHAIPGLSNLWLIATKDTALLAVIGFIGTDPGHTPGRWRHQGVFPLFLHGRDIVSVGDIVVECRHSQNRAARLSRHAGCRVDHDQLAETTPYRPVADCRRADRARGHLHALVLAAQLLWRPACRHMENPPHSCGHQLPGVSVCRSPRPCPGNRPQAAGHAEPRVLHDHSRHTSIAPALAAVLRTRIAVSADSTNPGLFPVALFA